MEKHKCKLCFRSFSNGRALGGHMRSHMMNLPLPSKPEEESSRTIQLSFEAESASSSSSSEDEERVGNNKSLSYGLRENPKKSVRLVDPEFSFAADPGAVILQDRESETESSKNNQTRKSKRECKLGVFDYNYQHDPSMKKMKLGNKGSKTDSWMDHEPVSSNLSDVTTEEDVAFCLMMLSRDKGKKKHQLMEEQFEEEEDDDDEDDEDEDEEEEDEEAERSMEESDDESEDLKVTKNKVRGRYKCETCNKVFKSYQALGGHRASHKKIKVNITVDEAQLIDHNNNGANFIPVEKKIHECPVCFRVFASGQALGGHKRTHVIGSATNPPVQSSTKARNNLIDLNLPPAPTDEDDMSQIESSAVSDAEFVKSH